MREPETKSRAANYSVSALYFYPIKSCGGIELSEAAIDARGLQYDRNWMFVDEAGNFLTQREYARMALIRPSITRGFLALKAPQMSELTIALTHAGPRKSVVVWRSECEALDQGDEVAEWISEFLGFNARLVRIANDFMRPVPPHFARRPEDQVGFADAFPFLLISQASLDDLNSRLAEKLPMNRFRPNIVIQGCPAYAEDTWDLIQIGDLAFDVVKPCLRCPVTTTNQDTAERGPEPLKTLATYRRAETGHVMFGQNLVQHSPGTIRVGDSLSVIKSK